MIRHLLSLFTRRRAFVRSPERPRFADGSPRPRLTLDHKLTHELVRDLRAVALPKGPTKAAR